MRQFSLLLIFSFFTFASSFAGAERRSPFDAAFREPARVKKHALRLVAGDADSPLSFLVEVGQEGVLRVVLEEVSRRRGRDESEMVLLQGHAEQRRGERTSDRFGLLRAAGMVRLSRDGRVRLSFTFARESIHGTYRFFKVQSKGQLFGATLSRAPEFALPPNFCGDKEELRAAVVVEDEASLSPHTHQVGTQSLRGVEITTFADRAWRNSFGPGYQNDIIEIVNGADAIYRDDLGLTLSVRRQSTGEFSSSTDAQEVLTSFALQAPATGDARYLFTGRNLDGSTIGIAYVGAVCRAPTISYGVVQEFNQSLEHIIFAHELGHSLSAVHVSSGIMGTSLDASNPPTNFSPVSQSTISTFVSSFGFCLAEVEDGGSNDDDTGVDTGDDNRDDTGDDDDGGDNSDDDGSGKDNTDGTVPGLAPSLQLSANLLNRVNLSGSVSLQNVDQACQLSLYLAKNRRRYTRGQLLSSSPVTSNSMAFSGTFQSRLRNRKRVKRAFLAAEVQCPDGTATELFRFATRKVRTRGRRGYRKWSRDFKRSFQVVPQ